MGKKDFQIILTIVIFLACVFTIWKLIQIPAIEKRVEDFVFSKKSYAKKIIIEKPFMTSEQVAELFRDKTNNSMDSQKIQSSDHSLYLVIRLKNVGDRRAYGTLKCQILECGECEINVGISSTGKFENYVIPTCYTTTTKPASMPIVKWKELYVNP